MTTIHRVAILGGGVSVEFTATAGQLTVEWLPEAPRRLTRKQLARYREARDAVAAELARKLGARVAVLDALTLLSFAP